MNNLYFKLALTNIKKSKILYVPYVISGIIVVAFVYMMGFLGRNEGMDGLVGAESMKVIMDLGKWIIVVFSYVFLFYTNSFLIKKRKKEFGVYNMLGMEKNHIAVLLACESIIISVVSILGGLISGIVFSKLVLMLLLKMIKVKTAFGFSISFESIGFSLIVFGILYVIILIFNVFQVKISNTIELIRGGNVGEKEPKTRVILSIIGFLTLGTGYFIALKVDNPISAIILFFVAVILVIIGTYLVFTTGSIFILKLLKKNKSFYYNKRNMVAVSGMLYRMKQNAVGLANICILSTMVLVTISTTVSLYIGSDRTIMLRYPTELEVNVCYNDKVVAPNEDMVHFLENELTKYNLQNNGIRSCGRFVAYGNLNGTEFAFNDEVVGTASKGIMVTFMTRDDFVKQADGYEEIVPVLCEDEIFVTTSVKDFTENELTIFGKTYRVVGSKKYGDVTSKFYQDMVEDTVYMIVPDYETINNLFVQYKEGDHSINIRYSVTYYVDCDGEQEAKLNIAKNLENDIDENDNKDLMGEYEYYLYGSRENEKSDFYLSYGGLFFLGISCGFMFLLITVMIIFYKQISEGYDDRDRYSIMSKVGMNQDEIRQNINTQVRMVFFLPLIVSICHLLGSFPMMKLMLSFLFYGETSTFVMSLAVTTVLFAVIYFIIFKLTSKMYYSIVK